MSHVAHSFSIVRKSVKTYSEEPATWKAEDSEEAMRCWDFEDYLGQEKQNRSNSALISVDTKTSAALEECEYFLWARKRPADTTHSHGQEENQNRPAKESTQ